MKIGQRLEAFGVYALEAAFRLFSWEAAQSVGAAVGGSLRRVNARRWKITLDNLAAAFPEKSPAQREAIALQAWRNAGRIAAEFVKSRHMSPEDLARVIIYENLEKVDALLKEKKGIIFNIGHMGNWEMAGIDFTARGYPLGVVGRVMKNPAIDGWVRSTRSRFGAAVFPHRSPFFPAVKWLKRNGIVAVLIDHSIHEGGIFVPFFGRPAVTSPLSALLAVKAGCPIISVRVQRHGPGFKIRFEGPLRHDPAADPDREVERLTAEMTKALEGFVRERPGEWLWGHNRWKRKPEAVALGPRA
ncbi:MAG: lysophospholipid acyltransferase family protein [Elusimicrobia bacterium]|nr:lysophospholipid acyltransferase family protein [Elusimicrobiota bacterium]